MTLTDKLNLLRESERKNAENIRKHNDKRAA